MSEKSDSIKKTRTGIVGLDEITRGGLPTGRATLVVGNAGCGKSLLAMSFLVNGIKDGEPGVFVSFEETPEDLVTNVRSLEFELPKLVDAGELILEHVRIEPGRQQEAGEFDLEGLFIRIGAAIDEIGAKRVVLDTLEALLGGFTDQQILRSEFVRLFRWLKERGVTAIITGERGGGQAMTRNGIEEYVSDCVVVLDHRTNEGISTRHLRVAKYRGTAHGTNEYPFIIDAGGFVVLPITSIKLAHRAPTERISTGIEGLDDMISGSGVYSGSSVLVSGTAGSGKTSFASSFLAAACKRGQRCTFFSFEESPDQIVRNMASIGIDLATPLKNGLLRIRSIRPTLYGLETHLARIYSEVIETKPNVVAVDPMTSFLSAGTVDHARAVLLRLVDLFKSQQVTGIFTSLGRGSVEVDMTENQISSLMDTWISLRMTEQNGERNRELYILKSRGMGHSNQVREFILSKAGMKLVRPYVGTQGVLTGSARLVQEIKERLEGDLRKQQMQRTRNQIDQRKNMLDAQITKLKAEFESERSELLLAIAEAEASEKSLAADLQYLARKRRAKSADELEESQ